MKSVVSYPERGAGGQNTYRGNFSPKFVEDVINFFNPDSVGDYTVGSGTTINVCQNRKIPCIGTDLNPSYGGINLQRDDLPPINMGGFSGIITIQRQVLRVRNIDKPGSSLQYSRLKTKSSFRSIGLPLCAITEQELNIQPSIICVIQLLRFY